jgi:hypothetical protein
MTEIRRGLIRGRLKNREGINRQLDADLTDQEVKELESILFRNSGLQKKADNLRNQWFLNTWNSTSELLFAGISGKNGFDITYVPKDPPHDYDFLVNGVPCQVYSFNTPELETSMANSEVIRKAYVEQDKITYELAMNLVKNAIREKSSELDDKLDQGAKIIFVNGTSDQSGRFLSQHFFTYGRDCAFEKSISVSVLDSDLFIKYLQFH